MIAFFFFSITYVWRISRILYGMRKRRLKPRNPEQKEHKLWARVLRAVAAYFRQKMHFISPKGIVYILYEFGKHGIFPGSNHWCDSHRSLSWKRHCMKTYIWNSIFVNLVDIIILLNIVKLYFIYIYIYHLYISYLVWTRPGEELFRATRRIRRHLSSLSNRTLVLLAVLLARSLGCHRMSQDVTAGGFWDSENGWTWQVNRPIDSEHLHCMFIRFYQVLIGQSNVYWRSTARRFVNHIEWHGCTRTIWWWYFMPMAGEASWDSWACAEPDLDRKEEWTKVSKLWNNLKQFPMINLLELVSCLIMFAGSASVTSSCSRASMANCWKRSSSWTLHCEESSINQVYQVRIGENIQNGRCILSIPKHSKRWLPRLP